MKMYRYKNENNDELVEREEIDADLEQRPNWHRVGEGGQIEVDADDGELSTDEVVDLICDNIDEFDDEQIERLRAAVSHDADTTAPKNDDVPEPGEPGFVEQPEVEVDDEDNAQAKAGRGEPMTAENGATEEEILAQQESGSTDPESTTTIQSPPATDAALELADAEDIDIATVTGTGENGEITIDDVRKLVEQE